MKNLKIEIKWVLIFVLMQSTLFAPVAGVVTSAIVAIFTKKS